jgi:hypothetical protein
MRVWPNHRAGFAIGSRHLLGSRRMLGQDSRAVLTLAVLLVRCLALAAEVEPLDASRIDAFLAELEGKWQGQAVITPIGPRPYDIAFRRNGQGHLEGAAEPGGAVHHWAFYREGQSLKLRFLSTFRGNRQPIFLTATARAGGAWIFRATKPDFLEVRVRPESQAVTIQVLHHDRLHVEIRLRRE